MTERKPPPGPQFDEFTAAWFKIAEGFFGASGGKGSGTAPGGGRMAGLWESSRKLWDAGAKAMTDPAFAEALQKGFQTVPDIAVRIAQTSFEGFLELQKRWADRAQKLGAPLEPYSFSDLDQDFLSRWTDIYKKEFQQFLNIPQLGLARFHQERFNRATDTLNLYQAALTEFLNLLSAPLDKSFRVMQEKLAELTRDGKLPDDLRQYYQMWVKILEGHYMTLFQSDQYVETFSRTIDALHQFLSARDAVIEDVLGLFPVCTHRDMDAVDRELYQLKKRVRELEKKLRDAPGE